MIEVTLIAGDDTRAASAAIAEAEAVLVEALFDEIVRGLALAEHTEHAEETGWIPFPRREDAFHPRFPIRPGGAWTSIRSPPASRAFPAAFE
jgi:hypothetical protein